jgi:hypothetical protein
MPLILAIEPDRKQATQLAGVVRKRVKAELILVETTERALDAIGNRMPDLVLVPALLSPQDDAALAAALRVIAAAAHVQMLTIPVLASGRTASRAGGMLSSFRRGKARVATPDGCDPSVFADQIVSYLEAASMERPARVPVVERLPAAVQDRVPEAALEESVSDAVRQEFDDALADAAETPIESQEHSPVADEAPILSGGDESVSLALEEAVRALFADPVPSLNVEAAAVPAVSADRVKPRDGRAVPSYQPQAASYADTDHFEAGTPVRDADVPAIETPIVETFELAVANLEVAPATLVVEAPALEAPTPLADAPMPQEPVPAVEVEAPGLVSPLAVPAADEWAAVDQLMAALQAIPLAALEVTDVDDWVAPMSASRPAADGRSESRPARATSEVPSGAAVTSDKSSPAKSEREWVALIESLRSDVERLRTERSEKPARKETPVAPRVVRGVKTPKPIQDEWGFFDPQQCGFAALLAKLDEVTDSDESSPRAVNQ